MIGFQRRLRDLVSPSKVPLRALRLLQYLADDAEVVQGVGEVRMERAETGPLQHGDLGQQLFGRDVVAGGRGLFRRVDDRSYVARFGHGCRPL